MPRLVKNKIRDVHDFPKPGIVFKDITTAIKHPETMKKIVDFLADEFKDVHIDYIAAIESRGFIFGAPLAYVLDAGLVLIRKPGKLPYIVEQVTYDLEYGSDSIEIHSDAIEPGKNVLIVDDLLATGGSSKAALHLVQRLGGNPVGFAFVVELTALGGRDKLPKDIKNISMVQY